MFDKLGIFDSAEELNRAAAAQLGEGDTEALFALAQENGIDREDAQDYANGDMPERTINLHSRSVVYATWNTGIR